MHQLFAFTIILHNQFLIFNTSFPAIRNILIKIFFNKKLYEISEKQLESIETLTASLELLIFLFMIVRRKLRTRKYESKFVIVDDIRYKIINDEETIVDHLLGLKRSNIEIKEKINHNSKFYKVVGIGNAINSKLIS